MTQIEFAVLSAFHALGKRAMVSEAVNAAAAGGAFAVADLVSVAQELVRRGFLSGKPEPQFVLRRLSVTPQGVIALEEHKQLLAERSRERVTPQQPTNQTNNLPDRKVRRESQNTTKPLDLFFKIADLVLKVISTIAGFVAFIV